MEVPNRLGGEMMTTSTHDQILVRARVWWKVIKQGNALYWKGTTSLDLRLREHPINMAYEAARVELAGGEIVSKPSRRVEKLLKELGI